MSTSQLPSRQRYIEKQNAARKRLPGVWIPADVQAIIDARRARDGIGTSEALWRLIRDAGNNVGV